MALPLREQGEFSEEELKGIAKKLVEGFFSLKERPTGAIGIYGLDEKRFLMLRGEMEKYAQRKKLDLPPIGYNKEGAAYRINFGMGRIF